MALPTCETCRREFRAGIRSLYQHCDATGHDPLRYECALCYDNFIDEEDRIEHEHSDHQYCASCDRHFQNDHNLRQARRFHVSVLEEY